MEIWIEGTRVANNASYTDDIIELIGDIALGAYCQYTTTLIPAWYFNGKFYGFGTGNECCSDDFLTWYFAEARSGGYR